MREHILFAILLFAGFTVSGQKKNQKETTTAPSAEITALLTKHGCSSCHHTTTRMVGPPFSDIAKRNYLRENIVERIGSPQPAGWPGYPPMPPLTVPKEEALKIADWINSIGVNAGSETAKGQ